MNIVERRFGRSTVMTVREYAIQAMEFSSLESSGSLEILENEIRSQRNIISVLVDFMVSNGGIPVEDLPTIFRDYATISPASEGNIDNPEG
jgi:hypothetical protein